MVSKVAVIRKQTVEEQMVPALPHVLRNHPLLQGILPETAQQIALLLQGACYRAGDELFHAGDSAEHLFLICQGSVTTSHRSSEGATMESAWERGAFTLGCGEMLTDAAAMHETARATEFVSGYLLPMHAARELARSDAALFSNLTTALARRYLRAMHNERNLLESGVVRVRGYLATLAERSGISVSPGFTLVSTTQEEIAWAIGSNPRTVVRALHILRREGFVSSARGSYVIRA